MLLENAGAAFVFEVDPFSEGTCSTGTQTGSLKNCLPCNKWSKLCIIRPLKWNTTRLLILI